MRLPPMSWRLRSRGVVLATFHWVETRRARAFVPSGMRILSLLPRRTVGALFLPEYGPGSDLEYSELIASPATVLYRARPAAWVAALFVNASGRGIYVSRSGVQALLPFFCHRFSHMPAKHSPPWARHASIARAKGSLR